jgi:hypothetical protein
MPYGISEQQSDCSGWATVKQTGDGFETVSCHETKSDAVDQMVALSVGEDMEPMGNIDRRAKASDLLVGDFVSWNSSGGMARGKIEKIVTDGSIDVPDTDFTIKGDEENPAALIRIYQDKDGELEPTDTLVGHKFSTLTKMRGKHKGKMSRNMEELEQTIESALTLLNGALLYLQQENMEEDMEEEDDDEEPQEMEEERQAPSLVAPAFMRASARRGLQLLEEGYSKVQEDGLKRQTVNDAQKMANGEALSPEKWRKISPWIARHIVDLDAVKDEPTAGLVAMLLWGGGSSKASANRAKTYAERIVEKLDTE